MYPPISHQLHTRWQRIPPSHAGELEYHPCLVTLQDGQTLERVYLLPADAYLRAWGIWPEQDPHKLWADIRQVVTIAESPQRLPPHIADQIYAAGESSMGAHRFTLVFADGARQACLTGNAVDFVPLLVGQSYENITEVIPHRCQGTVLQGYRYHWCLFEGITPQIQT